MFVKGENELKLEILNSIFSGHIVFIFDLDGAIVDSDSKLQDSAHVYRNNSGRLYSATLDNVDLSSTVDKNSYYKLQLLESDRNDPRK